MSTALQRIGLAGIASVVVLYRNFDRTAGVRSQPLPKDDFRNRSLGANLLKWDFDQPIRSLELAATDETVLRLTELMADRAAGIEEGTEGVTEFVTGLPMHVYLHTTRPRPVPVMLRALFGDTASYLPLRSLLSMFPPFGGEVPEVPKPSDEVVDEYGIGTLTPAQEYARDEAVIEYRTSRAKRNVPLEGPIALGNVFIKASHCRIASNDRFVVRYALMSTSELHALNGRALWVHVYDQQASTSMFFAVGAGQHSLPFMDRMNNHTAGLVFSVMHHSFAKMLKVAEASGGVSRITDGVSNFSWSREQLLAEGDKTLTARRAMAATFDIFSRMIALVRQVSGMNVTDVPPTDENLEQDVLTLFGPEGDDL